MTRILGISAFYHDSAAALVVDGRIVAAAQEERFTRRKHDWDFPARAVEYCLAEAGLAPGDLDHVAFYEKPLRKFDRLLETYLAFAPAGFRSFLLAMPLWLRGKLHIPRELDRGLQGRYRGRYLFLDHHESHAAAAFFPSPFDQAAILTLDGVGEWATGAFGVGDRNRVELIGEMRFPHSLGLLYSAFTYFCGFRVNSGEHKLMGLAPYGQPRFRDVILDKLVDLKDDGSFRLDLSYFNYCRGLTMTSRKMDDLFGGPPRRPEAEITDREKDLAASIQAVTEEVILRCARYVAQVTRMRDCVLGGGVALNCVANGRLLREGPFERIWIQPAAGDAGGALGAALFVWHQLLGHPRGADGSRDFQAGSLLGPRFSEEDIRRVLDVAGTTYRRYPSEDELLDAVAASLAEGKIVGHFHGRMEFGPRALGNRSILADPRRSEMKDRLNEQVKYRESFRPFAPAVLREKAGRLFKLPRKADSPYMLLVAPVATGKRVTRLPAVTHVDGSARVQTVDERHDRFRRLLERFHKKTRCPVLLNTSFNVRGEPIVCTPADALRCFLGTGMDVLVLEDFILFKDQQSQVLRRQAEAGPESFEAD